MPAFTSNLNLYKPGGGSTGTITPDEVVDIDRINSNMDTLDLAVGDPAKQNRQWYGPASQINTLPVSPKDGDSYRESDGNKALWYLVGGVWQGGWVAASLATNWSVPANMGTPSWRIVNGRVEFTGVARYSATVPGANTNFITGLPLPVGSDAEALIMRATTKNGLTVLVNPRSDGIARARLIGAGGAGDDYVYLDGLAYRTAT